MCHTAAGENKLIRTKSAIELIERFIRTGRIYKCREGWCSENTKLLWGEVGGKTLLNEFGGRNLNSEMYCKTIYNNMVL